MYFSCLFIHIFRFSSRVQLWCENTLKYTGNLFLKCLFKHLKVYIKYNTPPKNVFFAFAVKLYVLWIHIKIFLAKGLNLKHEKKIVLSGWIFTFFSHSNYCCYGFHVPRCLKKLWQIFTALSYSWTESSTC